MEDKNTPIEIQIPQTNSQFPQITYHHKKQWNEEFKYKLMEYLSFSNKHWEDVVFSALCWVSVPAFVLSIIRCNTSVSSILSFGLGFAIALLFLVAAWLIKIVPDCSILILIRACLLLVGVVLGVV